MPRLYSLSTLAFITLFSVNVYPDIRIYVDSSDRQGDLYKRVYYSKTLHSVRLHLRGSVPEHCSNIIASLLQLSTKLSAEIDTRTVLDCERSMVKYRELVSGPLNFSFTVPKVNRITKFRWEFSNCSNEDCNPAGNLEFTVLPENFLDPLKMWSNENTLYIYDKSGSLQAFLDEKDIRYFESRKMLPREYPLISFLVIDEPESNFRDKLPDMQNNGAIVVREYSTDLPVIYDKTSLAMPVIDVHIPLVNRLSDDAAAQKLFLELFYMLSQTGLNRE